MLRHALALPLLALAALACAPTVPAQSTIDLAPLGVDNWRGLSLQGDEIHVVVENRGIIELDRAGNIVSERRVGQRGLVDAAYRDLAVMAPGVGSEPRYILLADNEGYLYDPETQTEDVHFCVVPEAIDGPITRQKNDAVTISGETIVASPRFYDVDVNTGEERITTSELRTYRLSDGVPMSTVTLSQQLELRGLAVSLDGVFGVAGDRLLKIDDDGTIASEARLESVGDAAGLAIDVAGNQLLVLDEASDSIQIIDASSL